MAIAIKRKKLATSSARVYSGELRYANVDEEIEVTRFIVRKNEIGFDLITSWSVGYSWRVCGIAKPIPGRAFLSKSIVGTRMLGNKVLQNSRPVYLRFEIEKQSDLRIKLCGILILRGEEYPFSGTLKRLTLKKTS